MKQKLLDIKGQIDTNTRAAEHFTKKKVNKEMSELNCTSEQVSVTDFTEYSI